VILGALLWVLAGSVGCMKKIVASPPEENWWEAAPAWVRIRGYDRWIRVTSVSRDSVFGVMSDVATSLEPIPVSAPLSDVEAVGIEKDDPVGTAVIVVAGGALVYALLWYGYQHVVD